MSDENKSTLQDDIDNDDEIIKSSNTSSVIKAPKEPISVSYCPKCTWPLEYW